MNRIGTLTRNADNNGPTYFGKIRTLEIDLAFWLKTAPGFPQIGDEPSYQVWALDKSGSPVVIGHGWIRLEDDDKSDDVPPHSISMEIDDPSLPYPVVTEACRPFQQSEWHIAWDRDFKSPFAATSK